MKQTKQAKQALSILLAILMILVAIPASPGLAGGGATADALDKTKFWSKVLNSATAISFCSKSDVLDDAVLKGDMVADDNGNIQAYQDDLISTKYYVVNKNGGKI